MMFARWNKLAVSSIRQVYPIISDVTIEKDIFVAYRRNWIAKAAAPVSPINLTNMSNSHLPRGSAVHLEKLFWTEPCSLALPLDSPDRIEQPQYTGIRRFLLKMLLYYSNPCKSFRGANVAYHRIVSQVKNRSIYEVFDLEPTFNMKYSLLVLHIWLFLRRVKQEGEEGVEFGQYLYEVYNLDKKMGVLKAKLRASNAGVKLLLTKWMKESERIFYGNVFAYDQALLPESDPDELQKLLWRNVLYDDDESDPDANSIKTIQAMARYVRRENACLSLTDKEDLFSGNFKFSSLTDT